MLNALFRKPSSKNIQFLAGCMCNSLRLGHLLALTYLIYYYRLSAYKQTNKIITSFLLHMRTF